MTSNNHNGGHQFMATQKEHIVLSLSHNHTHSADATSSGPNRKDASPEKSWKPKLDRQQSWSNEDRKHQLQERLLGSEKGKETGFTEAHSGD
ncbi:hypothetical protein N7457_001169 [Penicillium paradoxum]|uniref:uncharacterized protein n=1 Tax=Penicillium paradoxum TaxID=176176 RepID=UPI0025471843|nr:uncharacterized protein N7457_001169 [Penicillium paradoxum]KAJ5794570.1 hypothetical protein N7457_001169 [Penicillium paradoxum]